MRKIYKKLTEEQKGRDIIFSSCLSEHREEMEGDTIHEVIRGSKYAFETINRLQDDSFFNASHWKYNIIRGG